MTDCFEGFFFFCRSEEGQSADEAPGVPLPESASWTGSVPQSSETLSSLLATGNDHCSQARCCVQIFLLTLQDTGNWLRTNLSVCVLGCLLQPWLQTVDAESSGFQHWAQHSLVGFCSSSSITSRAWLTSYHKEVTADILVAMTTEKQKRSLARS